MEVSMNIQGLKEVLQDYAKDIRLNLSTVLSEEGSPGLTLPQLAGIALACSYFTKHATVIEAVQEEFQPVLSNEYLEAAKGAATIMAMNNIYYRFTHLSDEKEISKMPARLRMNVIGKPGIEKKDFELMCLAVSALAGCGACINSHANVVKEAGVSNEGIQSAVRIAAVINAAAQALVIG